MECFVGTAVLCDLLVRHTFLGAAGLYANVDENSKWLLKVTNKNNMRNMCGALGTVHDNTFSGAKGLLV